MEAALDDDLNTAAALAVLYEFVGDLPDPQADPQAAAAAFGRLTYWLKILGIEPNDSWLAEPVVELEADFVDRLQRVLGEARLGDGAVDLAQLPPPDAIERVIALRSQARQGKDWATSDRLRDALAACGIELKDSKDGTSWTVTG